MLSHFKEKSPFCSYTIVTRSNFEKPNRKTLRSHCSPADRLKSRIKSILGSDEKKKIGLAFSCSTMLIVWYYKITSWLSKSVQDCRKMLVQIFFHPTLHHVWWCKGHRLWGRFCQKHFLEKIWYILIFLRIIVPKENSILPNLFSFG